MSPFNGLQRRKTGNAASLRRTEKAMESVLRESEARYRNLFENSLEGIYQTTPEGDLLTANPACLRMFGFADAMEIAAINVRDQYANPEDRRAWLEILEQEGEIRNFEIILRKKDGSPFVALDNARVLRGPDGTIHTIEGILTDITDLKTAEGELRRSLEKVHNTLKSTIGVISALIEARDPYTAGHQKRVADLSVAIARDMGLADELFGEIGMAASIHDLGKIAVPVELLSKPTKLTDIEFQMIKMHSQVGYEILKDIDFPWPIDKIALQHHERLDGSGYPQGLMDGDILLESRIIAVADVVEAMLSHRPYRAAQGLEAAMDEISRNSGRLYDPEVVTSCVRLFMEKGFVL